MTDRGGYDYPPEVCFSIPATHCPAYHEAADYINRIGYDVLSVQHEYGIFGGEAGSHLMALVRAAKVPVVTTLHTVLRDPSPEQREVMDELLSLSERIVVMSQKAVALVCEVHGTPPDKIDLVPHGIPDIHESPDNHFRDNLGIEGPMLLTFGLLSPDKGIQTVLDAMPAILKVHPGATYVILGATHPGVVQSSGEVYRESLVARAAELGITDRVRFVDRFVPTSELVEYLAATDYYITPYLKPNQITSGTLAYAVGSGKAVISTPFWYAEELLDEGRGTLVPFRDSQAIADTVLMLEREPEKRLEMGRCAAAYGQHMLWPQVGAQYLKTFVEARRSHERRARTQAIKTTTHQARTPMPELNLTHLGNLTDDTGVVQHATYSVPNRTEGYCVDDNARALLLTTLVESQSGMTSKLYKWQGIYLAFVNHALNPLSGRFRNFMSYSRSWLEISGSEDSQGRSLWAVAACAARCLDKGRASLAKSIFDQAVPALDKTSSPRTWAYCILAADEVLKAYPSDTRATSLLTTMAGRLRSCLERSRTDGRPWFEETLSYGNARLPQALIVAGRRLGDGDMVYDGLRSLSWLMEMQTGPGGVFAPVGSHACFTPGGEKVFFDQQPIEASTSVSACVTACQTTGSPVWLDEANRAFGWFLGKNMLGQSVYDPETGGCCDGIHPDRLNRNQGAESTLSYLLAATEMKGSWANLPAAPALLVAR